MRRTILTIVLCCALLPAAEAAPAPITQRDWMVQLVDALGLSFGLPETPTDADYLRILSGNRTLRIEAESSHLPSDMVSENAFHSFGDFSGPGWVNGISESTQAHLRFLLPLSGRYQVSVAVRNSGHAIHIGDSVLKVDAPGAMFHAVALGEVELYAGIQEVTIDLPANTSIDYLDLVAPPLFPLAPRGGWNLDAPLTMDDLAVSVAHLLELETLLPHSTKRTTIEAETYIPSDSPLLTDIQHLGLPSGGRWLRAGIAPAPVEIAFTPPDAGVYDLVLRGSSLTPLVAVFDNLYSLPLTFRSYLTDVLLTTRELSAKQHTLSVTLSNRAGLDAFYLDARDSSPNEYLRLLGLPDREPVTADDLNRTLALLALLQPDR